MKILVIGAGGREHAICWKLSRSPLVKQICCAPGNAGTAELAEPVEIAAKNIAGLRDFARRQAVDLTIVGPEQPLASGIVDEFQKEKMPIFGPSGAAARIESSKGFAKDFMRRQGIPTASYQVFDDRHEALKFVRESQGPFVIKADGLAAGKGVIVTETAEQAARAVQKMMAERAFGEAGRRIIVEKAIEGQEVSLMAFTDGTHLATMVSARDHKQVHDSDRGPNTGGMGAYAPTRIVTEALHDRLREEILEPAVRGLADEGCPFVGVLYAGVMLTDLGPKVLEFNARFGDPETQVVLPLLKNDLVEVIDSCLTGELDLEVLEWDDRVAVCVILASRGYPGKYDKGLPINGLTPTGSDTNQPLLFHAGTTRQNDTVVTSGGRVLGVTAVADGYEEAVTSAYTAIEPIHFKGMHYRSDIGYKASEATYRERARYATVDD